MQLMYPIIQIPDRKFRKNKRGDMISDARQYKKAYCKIFNVTGAKFRKIQKLQQRILRNANIST